MMLQHAILIFSTGIWLGPSVTPATMLRQPLPLSPIQRGKGKLREEKEATK
jgi:hypothetical protein